MKTDESKYAVLFFNRETNNTELSNLGHFDTPEQAQEASDHWAEGFARTHGYAPTTSIIPVAQMAVVSTDVIDALNACWDALSEIMECPTAYQAVEASGWLYEARAAIEKAQNATAKIKGGE